MSRYDLPLESDRPAHAQHSLASAAANFGDAVGRMSKRVAFLLALWGIVSTTVTTAMAWWMTHKEFVTEDQRAKDSAIMRDIDRKIDRIEFNVSTIAPHVDKVEENDRKQDNRLTALEARKR